LRRKLRQLILKVKYKLSFTQLTFWYNQLASMNDIILTVREELKASVDPKTKESFQRFFKEKVTYWGVKTNTVEKIAKKYFAQIKGLGKEKVFALCEELLKSNFGEEAWIAANWAYFVRDDYKISDILIFERWIDKYINDWAKCDTLCNHAVGAFVEKFPKTIDRLKTWAKSENLWLRRAAAVTLIIPARRGKFLKDIFEIADILLKDSEDLVQKGYGWMLKVASQTHQKEVFEWVMKNKGEMPRTALRYAIEKMPPDLRRKAMAKS